MEPSAPPFHDISLPPTGQIASVPSPPYAIVKPLLSNSATNAVFDVPAAAAEFYREFPEQLGFTYIIGSKYKTPVNDALKAKTADKGSLPDGDVAAAFQEIIERAHRKGFAHAYMDCEDGSKPWYAPAFAVVEPIENIPKAKQLAHIKNTKMLVNDIINVLLRDKPRFQQWLFDHETGHALCNPGTPWHTIKKLDKIQLSECQAEAYAAIRHFQRYGGNSDMPETISHLRCALAAQGSIGHWTSRTIDRVIRMNTDGTLKNLTPHESRDLAIVIAEETAFTHDEKHALHTHHERNRHLFDEELFQLRRPQTDIPCTLPDYCKHITRNTKSPIVHTLLEHYLDTSKKYGTYAADDIASAREILKKERPAVIETTRPILKRLTESFNLWKKFNTAFTPHKALAKAAKPPPAAGI